MLSIVLLLPGKPEPRFGCGWTWAAKKVSCSVGEGADTIVWLANEVPQDLTAKFLRDRKEIPW